MTTNPLVPPLQGLVDPLAKSGSDPESSSASAGAGLAATGRPGAFEWDALAHAQTRTIDAREGFAKMAEHAEPAFAPVVARFLALHTRHGEELTRLLSEAQQASDPDGSMMGTINRMVVATRAFFDDIDEDVMIQIRSGEENVIDAYQAAIDSLLPADVQQKLSVMLSELDDLLDETADLD